MEKKRKKHKARIIAERVMHVCYVVGILLFFAAASGCEMATKGNYIAMLVAGVLIGIGIFIDNF